jgi:hypothetical protein
MQTFSIARIYIYTKVEIQEIDQDMLNNYKIAMNNKGAKVKLLRELFRDYKQKKEKVFRDIQGRCFEGPLWPLREIGSLFT